MSRITHDSARPIDFTELFADHMGDPETLQRLRSAELPDQYINRLIGQPIDTDTLIASGIRPPEIETQRLLGPDALDANPTVSAILTRLHYAEYFAQHKQPGNEHRLPFSSLKRVMHTRDVLGNLTSTRAEETSVITRLYRYSPNNQRFYSLNGYRGAHVAGDQYGILFFAKHGQ